MKHSASVKRALLTTAMPMADQASMIWTQSRGIGGGGEPAQYLR